MLVECNECKRDFDMDVKVGRIEEDIEETYFVCPHCKEKYTSHYTDGAIRTHQSRVREMQEQLRNTNDIRKLRSKISNERKKLKEKMDSLREHLEN